MESIVRCWVGVALVAGAVACESSAGVGDHPRDGGAQPGPGVFDPTATVWAVSAGGIGASTAGQHVAVDSSGNIYVAGRLQGLASFGSTPVITNAVAGAVITKLDRDGAFLWTVAPTGIAEATGIAVDATGNCYVAGRVEGSVVLGKEWIDGPVFVAKLDPDGNVVWTFPVSTYLRATWQDIALDGSGGLYLAGALQGKATFGKYPSQTTVSAPGDTTAGVFIARIGGSGAVLWVALAPEKQPWTQSPNEVRGIAVDRSGDAYVVGRLYGDASFGSTPLSRNGTPHDLFLARVDANGRFLWATSGWAADGQAGGWGVSVDGAGNGFVAGAAYGWSSLTLGDVTTAVDEDAFVARFESSSGKIAWVTPARGTGRTGLPGGVVRDRLGNVFFGGWYQGPTTLGSIALPATSSAGRSLFVGKAGTTGGFSWAAAAVAVGGSVEDGSSPTSLALGADGHLYVTGSIAGRVDFGSGASLVAKGTRDLFVWKLKPPGGSVQ
jgi:hypothetical protein